MKTSQPEEVRLRSLRGEFESALDTREGHAFTAYCELILKYRLAAGLTTDDTADKIYAHHFYESMILSQALDLPDDAEVADFGSGAGIPGVPLAIFRPDARLTLFEKDAKKALFLDEVKLAVEVEYAVDSTPVEKLVKQKDVEFDAIVSRAFAKPEEYLKLAASVCAPGGGVVAGFASPTQKPVVAGVKVRGFTKPEFFPFQSWRGSRSYVYLLRRK